MRSAARVLLAGVAVLLATLGPPTTASAQEPPALPDSIAAIGDSISQAVDACCFYGRWPRHSWSTGSAPGDGIGSHYERILARNPGIRGRRSNNSVSGARMADAPGQARRAVEQGAQYVTVLMGANDLCGRDGKLTPTTSFRTRFQETIDTLRAGLPGTRVFVASIPNLYQLWRVLRTDPIAQAVWRVARICPAMLDVLNSPADRRRVVDRQLEFQAVLRDVCAGWSNCRFDGGLVYEFRFTRAMVSRLDYFHPSLAGQATLAAETWRASWWGS